MITNKTILNSIIYEGLKNINDFFKETYINVFINNNNSNFLYKNFLQHFPSIEDCYIKCYMIKDEYNNYFIYDKQYKINVYFNKDCFESVINKFPYNYFSWNANNNNNNSLLFTKEKINLLKNIINNKESSLKDESNKFINLNHNIPGLYHNNIKNLGNMLILIKKYRIDITLNQSLKNTIDYNAVIIIEDFVIDPSQKRNLNIALIPIEDINKNIDIILLKQELVKNYNLFKINNYSNNVVNNNLDILNSNILGMFSLNNNSIVLNSTQKNYEFKIELLKKNKDLNEFNLLIYGDNSNYLITNTFEFLINSLVSKSENELDLIDFNLEFINSKDNMDNFYTEYASIYKQFLNEIENSKFNKCKENNYIVKELVDSNNCFCNKDIEKYFKYNFDIDYKEKLNALLKQKYKLKEVENDPVESQDDINMSHNKNIDSNINQITEAAISSNLQNSDLKENNNNLNKNENNHDIISDITKKEENLIISKKEFMSICDYL